MGHIHCAHQNVRFLRDSSLTKAWIGSEKSKKTSPLYMNAERNEKEIGGREIVLQSRRGG